MNANPEGMQSVANLKKAIAECRKHLDIEDVIGLLNEQIGRLEVLSAAPSGEYRQAGHDHQLILTFQTAAALKKQLPNLLQVRGLILALDERPPLLHDLDLEVCVRGKPESVMLKGRAVQETPQGIALEVLRASMESEHRLLALCSEPTSTPPPAARAPAPRIEARPEAPSNRDVDLLETEGQPRFRWSLDTDKIAAIFMEAARAPGLAMLEFTRERARWQLIVRDGQIIGLRSSPSANVKPLEDLLSGAGRLQPLQAVEVQHHAHRHGVSSARAIIDLGMLPPQDVFTAAKSRIIYLTQHLWGLDDGKVCLYDLKTAQFDTLTAPIVLMQEVFRQQRKQIDKLSVEELHLLKTRFSQVNLRLTDEPRFDVLSLVDDSREKRFLEVVLNEPRTLQDISRISPASNTATMQLLVVLDDMGLIEREDVRPWTRVRTQQREQLEFLLHRLNSASHFEVLGVHWSAYGEEITRAHATLTQKLDSTLHSDLPQETLDRVAELRRRIKQAYGVLSNPTSRVAYRAEEVDAFARTAAADMFSRQVDSAKLRRDVKAVIDGLRRVVELNPSHPTASRELAVMLKVSSQPS